jgi:hypothetical protein
MSKHPLAAHSPLLLNLSDNCQNQSQNNAVFPTQKEMDRVGFEPTTSASTVSILAPLAVIGKKFVEIPPGLLCFCFDCHLPIPSCKVLRNNRIQSKMDYLVIFIHLSASSKFVVPLACGLSACRLEEK